MRAYGQMPPASANAILAESKAPCHHITFATVAHWPSQSEVSQLGFLAFTLRIEIQLEQQVRLQATAASWSWRKQP